MSQVRTPSGVLISPEDVRTIRPAFLAVTRRRNRAPAISDIVFIPKFAALMRGTSVAQQAVV